MCGTILIAERIGDIGSYREANIVKVMYVIPRPMLGKGIDNGTKHTDATVTGSTAAKPYNYMFTPSTYGIYHELARTVTGSC